MAQRRPYGPLALMFCAKIRLESDFSHPKAPGYVSDSNNYKRFILKSVISLDFTLSSFIIFNYFLPRGSTN